MNMIITMALVNMVLSPMMILEYALFALGVDKAARAAGVWKRGWAWIPVLDLVLLGRATGEIELGKQRVPGTMTAVVSLGAFGTSWFIGTAVDVLGRVFQNEGINWIEGIVLALGTLAAGAVGLLGVACLYLLLYGFYRRYAGGKHWLYFGAGAIFPILVPFFVVKCGLNAEEN